MNLEQRTQAYRSAGHAVTTKCAVDAGVNRLTHRIEARKGRVVEQFHRGDACAHRYWIGGERAAMRQRRLARARVEHRHDVLVAADRADRKTAANDFSERGQIGIDIPDALRAAIAEAKRDDLIEDQERADLARDF